MKAERISKLNKNRQGIRLVSFLFFLSLSYFYLLPISFFLPSSFCSLFLSFFSLFLCIYLKWFLIFLYHNNLLSHLFNSIHCLVLYIFFYLFLSYFYTSFTLYIFLSFCTCPIQLFLLLSLTHHNTTICIVLIVAYLNLLMQRALYSNLYKCGQTKNVGKKEANERMKNWKTRFKASEWLMQPLHHSMPLFDNIWWVSLHNQRFHSVLRKTFCQSNFGNGQLFAKCFGFARKQDIFFYFCLSLYLSLFL